MAKYSGFSGKLYSVQSAPFAGGGEGDIYSIDGATDIVAKIYKADKRTTERERKLSVMVSIKPSILEQYAWPVDVLYENGQFVGYVMPKISGKEKLRNIYVYDKRTGKPWSLYIAIAKNLAAAVHNVHEIHQVIGDLNPENILVNPNDGMVTLVDTDSYHIADSNRTYRCGVGMPEFIAPELQGIHFPSAPLPTFTPESDRFALAVLIFALLMNGAHPFSCKVISGSSSKFQPIDNMQNGKCAFFQDSRSSNMDIPRYAPDIESLPENIQQLFRRAFVSGHGNPSLRPSAEEWYNALEQLESNLKTCYDNTQHIYYYGAKACPWCEVDKKMHSIPQTAFNSSSQSGSSSGSYSQPATAARPAQQFTPSNYRYTPSSSNSVATTSKKSYGGWIAFGIAVLILILIIRSCANSKPKSSVEILTGDSTVTVGETVQIRIKSTTNRLTASYNDSIVYLEWGSTSQSSGYYYIYANISGVSAGNSNLKIYITNDESVYDTISISVKDSSSSETQRPQNSGGSNSSLSDSVVVRNDGSSPDKAIEMTVNSAEKASLESSSDVNWYKLTLEEAGTVTFNLSHDQVDSTHTYWELYVYPASDTSKQLMYSGFSGKDTSANSQLLGLGAGTYYVKIQPFSSSYYSNSEYTLTAVYTETELCEKESNDGAASASTITMNNSYAGSADASDDADWYQFTLSSSGTVTFNFTHEMIDSTHTYWEMWVYGSENYRGYEGDLNQLMYSGFSGKDTNVNSQLLGLGAGTYYVKIQPFSSSYYSSSEYMLTAVYTETELCEKESNNGASTASVISINNQYLGSSNSSGDTDWYVFTLSSAGNVTFNLSHDQIDSTHTYWDMWVFGSENYSGYEGDLNQLAFYGFSGKDANANSELLSLAAGTYYVKIQPFSSSYYSTTTYTLTIKA